MKKITKDNLNEFIDYYHEFHDSRITNVNYDISKSEIELLIDVFWSGEPTLKEDNSYQTNKIKMRMVLHNVERCNNKEMFMWDEIYKAYIKYIKLDNKNTLVDASEIQYIKRDGMKLVFHTSCRDYDIYSSFNKFQDRLPENFVRCHKSYVANISQIKDVEPVSGTITFKDNTVCDIGPKYKSEFMEVLRKHGNFE